VAHHGAGLCAAADGGFGRGAWRDGEAEAVLRVGVGRDDLRGEPRLKGIAGIERGDGGNCSVGAGCAGFGRVGGGRREERAECGEDVLGNGSGGFRRMCMTAAAGWCMGMADVALVALMSMLRHDHKRAICVWLRVTQEVHIGPL
jgi:hypothetical protein